ncbi:MAG: hypothetical protein H6700_12075 [Myxococcales bacterium]|nr:hypothetical protein [Myxococcales bacterium]
MEVLIAVLVVVAAIVWLPHVVWLLRYPFCALNQLEWAALAPARFVLAARRYERFTLRPFVRYLLLPARLCWALLNWLFAAPARFVSAVYWDGLLFSAGAVRDALMQFMLPARGAQRQRRGLTYLVNWFVGAPVRLVSLAKELGLVLLSSAARIVVSTAVPTITAYHGTRFAGGASDIGQQGRWLVGDRQYVGAGLYFAPTMNGALHYANQRGDDAIIVARVSPGWITWPSSWRDGLRATLERPSGGTELARYRPHPFSAFEHPRERWWEMCLPYHREAGTMIRPWRVRGVCVIRSGRPQRLWHGLAMWPSRASEWAVLAASIAFVVVVAAQV